MGETHYPEYPVILVDDEAEVVETESLALTINGITNILTCTRGRSALDLVAANPSAVVVLDITMPDIDGIEVLGHITREYPAATVIMLTGLNDAETAVTCMKTGAFDYVVKPVDQMRLVTCVRKAIDHQSIAAEAQRLGRSVLDDTIAHPEFFASIVTCSPAMHNVFRYIEAIAPTMLPVLITGETGVGKELVAAALHRASTRRGEFVCINTAGIDDTLFSDTLFGHMSGAFTGAHKDRKGMVARAKDGTLFLDEIGDIQPESQVKLLRLLQQGAYYPLGSEEEQHSSARIVAATNRPLADLRADNTFRKDLFYRLQSHHIHIPALRERTHDLPLLIEHFLDTAAKEQGKKKPTAPSQLVTILSNYSFPGNIRELQGMLSDAVTRHRGGVLSTEAFRKITGAPPDRQPDNEAAAVRSIIFPTPLPTAREVESALVAEAMRRAEGNKKLAAEMIGMARQTFRSKV